MSSVAMMRAELTATDPLPGDGPPPPVDDRAELRTAINSKNAAGVRVKTLLEAIERAEQSVSAAAAEVARCEKAVADAKEADAVTLANATIKGKPAKQATARAFRSELLDAQDAAEVARAALAKLRDQLPVLDEERQLHDVKILTARNKLLAPIISRLTEKVIRGHDELMCDRATLATLVTAADELPHGLAEPHRYRAAKEISDPIAALNEQVGQARFAQSNADYGKRENTIERVKNLLVELKTLMRRSNYNCCVPPVHSTSADAVSAPPAHSSRRRRHNIF
jgi:hypothetical protein